MQLKGRRMKYPRRTDRPPRQYKWEKNELLFNCCTFETENCTKFNGEITFGSKLALLFFRHLPRLIHQQSVARWKRATKRTITKHSRAAVLCAVVMVVHYLLGGEIEARFSPFCLFTSDRILRSVVGFIGSFYYSCTDRTCCSTTATSADKRGEKPPQCRSVQTLTFIPESTKKVLSFPLFSDANEMKRKKIERERISHSSCRLLEWESPHPR